MLVHKLQVGDRIRIYPPVLSECPELVATVTRTNENNGVVWLKYDDPNTHGVGPVFQSYFTRFDGSIVFHISADHIDE